MSRRFNRNYAHVAEFDMDYAGVRFLVRATSQENIVSVEPTGLTSDWRSDHGLAIAVDAAAADHFATVDYD